MNDSHSRGVSSRGKDWTSAEKAPQLTRKLSKGSCREYSSIHLPHSLAEEPH